MGTLLKIRSFNPVPRVKSDIQMIVNAYSFRLCIYCSGLWEILFTTSTRRIFSTTVGSGANGVGNCISHDFHHERSFPWRFLGTSITSRDSKNFQTGSFWWEFSSFLFHEHLTTYGIRKEKYCCLSACQIVSWGRVNTCLDGLPSWNNQSGARFGESGWCSDQPVRFDTRCVLVEEDAVWHLVMPMQRSLNLIISCVDHVCIHISCWICSLSLLYRVISQFWFQTGNRDTLHHWRFRHRLISPFLWF